MIRIHPLIFIPYRCLEVIISWPFRNTGLARSRIKGNPSGKEKKYTKKVSFSPFFVKLFKSHLLVLNVQPSDRLQRDPREEVFGGQVEVLLVPLLGLPRVLCSVEAQGVLNKEKGFFFSIREMRARYALWL